MAHHDGLFGAQYGVRQVWKYIRQGSRWEEWSTTDEVYDYALSAYYELAQEMRISAQYSFKRRHFMHLFVV